MKKLALLFILTLILSTSLLKNSTKKIEDKIFTINENLRLLKVEFSDTMLEYNFLSSPKKLLQYQSQYFENELKRTDIMKVKEISETNNLIVIVDFIKKTPLNE